MPQKILFITPSLDVRGASFQLSLLARRLRNSDFEPHILCLEKEGELAAGTREAGVPVEVLDTATSPQQSYATCYRVRRYCLQNEFDLVHTWLSGHDLGAVRGAASAGVATILTSRREIPLELEKNELRARYKANAKTRLIIGNSKAVCASAGELEELPVEQIRMIHNGFPEDAIPDKPALLTQPATKRYLHSCHITENEKVLVCIAEFSPVKNHLKLLEALRHLLLDALYIRLIFIGEGPLRNEVQRMAGELNLFRAVVFLEKRLDRLKILAECDALVLPSLSEGFPNVILEAQALGVPVVASRVGGIPELITDGQTGWMFFPDDPRAMAEAMRVALYQREAALACAVRAQENVRANFTARQMVGNYLGIYSSLLAP